MLKTLKLHRVMQTSQQCHSTVPSLPRPMRLRLGLLAIYLLFLASLGLGNLLQHLF